MSRPCLLLGLGLLCSLPRTAAAQDVTVLTTERFAFHSAFWVNLHHFLYVSARASRGLDRDRPAIQDALADTIGYGGLPESMRRTWDAALQWYRDSVAERNAIFDDRMPPIKDALVRAGAAGTLDAWLADSGVRAALEAAAPAYRTLWWPRHDAQNRAWVPRHLPLLEAHERKVAEAIARTYRTRWPDAPIRVDLSAWTNWSGAYTTSGPSHIMLTSRGGSMTGTHGLEMLFHEAMHTLDGPVVTALAAAGRAANRRVPRDLNHVLIFYTAGEIVRDRIPGHLPYAEREALWTRSPSFGRLVPLARTYWDPWLRKRTSFAEAIRAMVAALP